MRRRGRRAYTLIEMLIALIMFGFITTATAFALTTALRGQHAAQQKADEAQDVRAVLNIISRDLRAAYASAGNPNTFFLGMSDGSNTTSLSFTSLVHRLILSQPIGSGSTNDANTMPQSDVSIITYTFNPEIGALNRTENAIPSPDAQPQSDSPNTALSTKVRTIQFLFLDPSSADPSSGLRDSWSFMTDTTATGTGGSTQTATQDSSSGQQDTTLPRVVQINLVMDAGNGITRNYSTSVSIPSPIPQPKGQTPDPPLTVTPAPPASGTGGSGSGGGGGGGKPGGSGGTASPGGGGGTGIPGVGGKKSGSLPALGDIGPRL